MQSAARLSSASALRSLDDRKVLPLFPSVISRLDEALAAPTVNLDLVVEILSGDLSVSSRIMKSASGFRYGTRPPKDLADAVTRLGFAEARALAFAVAYTNSFVKPKNFSVATFWAHSFVSALAAREIAAWFYRMKQMRVCDSPTAFLLGLAHDVGCLLLDALNAQGFGEVVDAVRSGESQSMAEQRLLGSTHAIIGAALMKYWGFPDHMAMAIAAHHFPGRLQPALQPMADVVLLAETMASYLGFGNGVYEAEVSQMGALARDRMEKLGMSEVDFSRLAERVQDVMAEEDWMELANSMGR